jgi:hypothetical protein
VADWSAETVKEQLPAPEHAPLQPEKLEPESGAAVSVTAVPCAKLALQVAPQLMPAGALETVPEPVPALVTESVKFVGGAGPELSKRAVTLLLEAIDIVHWPTR